MHDMATAFEDEHLDMLQNIEAALASAYRASSSMTDYDAQAAVEAVIRGYQAEAKGKSAPIVRLSSDAQSAYDAVHTICEWRLGRQEIFEDSEGNKIALTEASVKTLDEVVACLKRIRKSIERWNKELGRRGYFDYISQFGV